MPSPSDLPLAIGLEIDAGGARAALTRGAGVVVVVGEGGDATRDLAACAGAISAILRDLALAADQHPDTLTAVPAYLAVAGVTDAMVAAALAELLPLRSPTIEAPRRAVAAGALGGQQGVVAQVGHGSFVGRLGAEGMTCVGGHGLSLGDEASAAWLGREGCALALRAAEGMAPGSPALARLRLELGGRGGLVAFGARATAEDYAALAPGLVSEAEAGDTGASRLMLRGAAYLAQACEALGRGAEEPLCLTGVLGTGFARWLEPDLRRVLVPPRGDVLAGATALAGQVAAGWRP